MSTLDEILCALRGQRLVALSGAGMSTDSGIPDYRGPGTLARARHPIQYKQFLTDAHGRQRYWARSAIGWPRIREAKPNAAHRALARLESAAILRGIITQNVDRLHQRAGSRRVVELHGALEDVVCLDCKTLSSRQDLQLRLGQANPGWTDRAGPSAPDGDVDIEDARFADYVVPGCESCGGALKPGVVFFGESVPPDVVDEAWKLYAEADVLLVVGTSLAVYSGLRFVRRASEDGKPVIIINRGETRGDPLSTLRWDAPLGQALPDLAAGLAQHRR